MSVGTEMPKLQAKVREILGQYKEIGPAGAFGAMNIEVSLKAADEAMASGDVIKILQAYEDLKSIK